MMVSDEEKRWLVVGIAMNKVTAPVLRDFVKQGMDTHYANNTYCSGLTAPCTLKTLTYHQVNTDPNLQKLKFKNVNNNHHLHNNKNLYNYNINSSVDLAKLFLPDHLVKFLAFDESLDMSAILRLLGAHTPAPLFHSPKPSISIQISADDVRENVRNKWGHCNVTDWTEVFFNDCFSKLETLVRSLGLTGGMEKIFLDQLFDWKSKGCQLCMGHAVDKDLLSLVQREVKVISIDLAMHDARLDEVEQKVEIILERLLAEKIIEDLLRRVQRVEEGLAATNINVAKTDNKVKQLEQGCAKTGNKVEQLEQGGAKTDNKVEQLEQSLAKRDSEVDKLQHGLAKTDDKLKQLQHSRVKTDGKVEQPEREVKSQRMKDVKLGEIEQKRRAHRFLTGPEPKAGKLDLLPPPQLRQQKILGMIKFSGDDEDKVIRYLITDMNPKSMKDAIPGLPAHILFMCIRDADHVNDDRRMQSLLTNSLNNIRKIVKRSCSNLDILAFWLANTSRLLNNMKQYSGDWAYQVHNTPEQNEHCLKNFDLTEYRQVLGDLVKNIYQDLVRCIWEALDHMIVPGILEYESIPGVPCSKPWPFRGRTKAHADITVKSITKLLSNFLAILNDHCVDCEIIKQVFRQLFYYIDAKMMNNMLLRKDMCHWSRGMQIRFNLSQLEDWVRLNQLDGSGIEKALENVMQATTLLQINKKTLEDVDGICEVCSSLNSLQIQKILSMYTPANEYEARVPCSVIRAVVERGHNKTLPMYLLNDTSYMYPFTLPFNPSAVSLGSLTITENLNLDHVDFLKVV